MTPTPKNKILSVGCSNTVGWDLEEEIGIFDYNPQPQEIKDKADLYRSENNFSTLISKHFNRECINIGRGGSSNSTNGLPSKVFLTLGAISSVTK